MVRDPISETECFDPLHGDGESAFAPQIRDAILGNASTLISFRLGPADAEVLAQEFKLEIPPTDLMNFANHHVYVKLLVDGSMSMPFSGETLRAR